MHLFHTVQLAGMTASDVINQIIPHSWLEEMQP